MSRTNIDLDDRLIREGMKRLKCRTKKALIHTALQELVRRCRQKDILALSGKIRWEGDLRAWRADRA
jgi:Arc/MetJ family transcription regulator